MDKKLNAFCLILLIYFVVVLLLFALIPLASATISIDFKERYQDYNGDWGLVNTSNIAAHGWYLKSENATHYILTRMDDTLIIKKSLVYNGSFDLGLTDISFTIVAPASKIQNISTANGTGQRRFLIDESLKTAYKRFTWDNKLPFVQIINNTGYNYTVPVSDYWYSRQSGKLYFNFKIANVTGLSEDKNVLFKFRSWIIDNATTAGYTASNISTDGFWSAYGGGSIGTPLNASINANLSLYVDCEATSGTIQYGINRYSRFPNSSIQGTWHGNTTLNITAGHRWGSACSLDGVDDYYSFPDGSFPFGTAPRFTDFQFQKINSGNFPQAGYIFRYGYWGSTKQDWGSYFLIDTSMYWYGNNYDYDTGIIISDTNWNNLGIGYDGVNGISYKNNIESSNSPTNRYLLDTSPHADGLTIGADKNGVENIIGRIDEFILTSSGIPIYSNSTYATSFNFTILNQTATAGKIISAVRFNVPYLNTLNNTANISIRQNGTSSWTQVSTNYLNYTWVNFIGWSNTDILFEGHGDGSARMFIVSGDIDEVTTPGTTYILSGYVNNTDGADIIGATVKANSITSISDIGGYYSISGLNGIYPLTIHAMGYNNYSGLVSISGNTTMNITLSEKDTTTTDEAISYSIVFAMLFFAIVIKRRKKQ